MLERFCNKSKDSMESYGKSENLFKGFVLKTNIKEIIVRFYL